MGLDEYEERKKDNFLNAVSDIDYNLFFDIKEQLVNAAEIIQIQDEVIEDMEIEHYEEIEELSEEIKEKDEYIKEMQWQLDKRGIAR